MMIKSTDLSKKSSGFSLIELLVSISIIAILSAVGLVSYNNIRGKANDAKIKSDLNAIKKAYEANYDPTANNGQGGYKTLLDSNFASGKIPTPDGTTATSYLVVNPANNNGANFAACANVTDGSACSAPSTTCSCVSSNQSTAFTAPGGGSNPSCDPYGYLTDSSTQGSALVGYWKMNETSGDAIDFSGKGNTLTNNGAVTYDAAGKNNNARLFTAASSQFFSRASNADLQTGDVNFSMSAWVKFSTVNTRMAIVNKDGGTGGTNREYLLYYDSTASRFKFHVFGGGLLGAWQELVVSNDAPAVADTWYFVAARYNATEDKAYLTVNNALFTNTITWNAAPVVRPVQPFYIGYPAGFFLTYMNGSIDDVRFYKSFLSAAQVSALYNANLGCFP